MNNKLQVAETIKQQLGQKAIAMMGAYNFTASEFNLNFRIQGSKTVNLIGITLQPNDLYLLSFLKVGKMNFKVVKTMGDVYVSDLHKVIEEVTGLSLSL